MRTQVTRALAAGAMAAAMAGPGLAAAGPAMAAAAAAQASAATSITVDGLRRGPAFDGTGAISGGGGTARLLIDYPPAQQRQTQILAADSFPGGKYDPARTWQVANAAAADPAFRAALASRR